MTQFGKSVPEVLDHLKEYEWRTRYRARNELQARPQAEVLAALAPSAQERSRRCLRSPVVRSLVVASFVRSCQSRATQSHTGCEDTNARAAATRVLADERERIGGFDGHPDQASRRRTSASAG